MLDRIDKGRAAQRQFTSDAAHELRTPLMALQGEVELARASTDPTDGQLLERLDRLAHRLGDRVDDLVLLSTLDEARPLALVPVDLLALIRDEAAAVAPSTVVSGQPVTVTIDRGLVARAARNLLANARRHARDALTASVAVDGGRAWLHVDDDGPGIDPAARDEIFRRFARLDEARSADLGGAGLGLAIVASVAAAHGGGIEAGVSALGGARLSMWLPIDPAGPTPPTSGQCVDV